jgi:flagellar protein FlgJ
MNLPTLTHANHLPIRTGLATDVQSLDNLKMQAGQNNPAAIKETAKQFESLFMRELIKSMREATMKSGMLDSPGGDLATDMMDQQMAVQLSGQPGGLSDIIALQLSRQMGISTPAPANSPANAAQLSAYSSLQPTEKITSAKAQATARPERITPSGPPGSRRPTESQVNFVEKHSEVANRVAQASGIPASFMIGQAGHETGWGRSEIKMKGGAPSFNLFGIKATPGWKGKVAEVTTTEYVNGVAKKQVARFRAYDSYEDSFKDYARLISESPRYAKVREQTGSVHAFASGLQKAGYATDPNYADKLSRAINTTLQLRRLQA